MSAKHTWPIRVYWEDTDAGGIVFYANYLKFFERGRTEWLRSLELHQQTLKTTVGGMFVVSETQVRYHQPCRLDDVVIVETGLLQVGRVAIDLRQTVWLQSAHPVRLCTGEIRVGWVDAVTLKPTRMPPTLTNALKRP